jgi:hypothetical protein
MAPSDDRKEAHLPGKRYLGAFGLVYGLHILLVAYFLPPSAIFSGEPLYDIDYSLHYYQVDRARKAFDGWGKLWGYDPQVLAGHIPGALEDVSSKSLELFVIGLAKFGVEPVLAFNLYVLLVHLLLPLVAFSVARLFLLSRAQAVGLALAWISLWFLDSFFHWVWFCGMISWAAASYAILLFIALLYRVLEENQRRHWLALLFLTAFLALHHPFAALTLFLPALGLYLRSFKSLGLATQLKLAGVLAAAIATALIWILPALQMKHYILDEDTFLRPTLSYLLTDFLDLMVDSAQSGPHVRTLVRVFFLSTGLIGLWRWRKDGDRRFLPLGLMFIGAFLFAYAGGYAHATRITQPYRQILPATFALTIPAVVLLSKLFSRQALRALGTPAKTLLVVAALLVAPRFVRNVLYYMPRVVPQDKQLGANPPKRWFFGLRRVAESGLYPMHNIAAPERTQHVRQWLEKNLNGKGRVLVQEYMLGEYLAATSDLPILGGLIQRSFPHGDAHLFRHSREGDLPGDLLKDYLERYAVRYVVVSELVRKLEWRKDLLTFRQFIGPIRIYETKISPSYFLKGKGRIEKQAFNKIEVEDAEGDEVVIRFHWMETLRCRPECKVERYRIPGDRVGFIQVKNPPRKFEIYNSYSFGER